MAPSKMRYIFIYIITIIVILADVAVAAPQAHHHHRRHQPHTEDPLCAFVQPDRLEWVNPCDYLRAAPSIELASGSSIMPSSGGVSGGDGSFAGSMDIPKIKMQNVLKPLRAAMPTFLARLHSPDLNAIDTDNIAAWFMHNSSYTFLKRINVTIAHIKNNTDTSTQLSTKQTDAMQNNEMKPTQIHNDSSLNKKRNVTVRYQVNLQKWHKDMQIYVGAFQHLKQNQYSDCSFNKNLGRLRELHELLILSKNVLCEIEARINASHQIMPRVRTRVEMNNCLNFSDATSSQEDPGSKFTKVRFSEYLHGMQKVLRRPALRNLQRRNRKNQLPKRRHQKKLDQLAKKNAQNGKDVTPIPAGGKKQNKKNKLNKELRGNNKKQKNLRKKNTTKAPKSPMDLTKVL